MQRLVSPRGLHDLLVSWEAEYHDGRVIKEREGRAYADIDRYQLKEFRLVSPGEILMRAPMKDGRTGHNLCYRRRVVMSAATGQGFTRNTWFMVGFVPMGPVFAYSPGLDEAKQAVRFVHGDPLFSPPAPHPNEGETFSFDALGHVTDARLAPSRITLPSGYVLDVK